MNGLFHLHDLKVEFCVCRQSRLKMEPKHQFESQTNKAGADHKSGQALDAFAKCTNGLDITLFHSSTMDLLQFMILC